MKTKIKIKFFRKYKNKQKYFVSFCRKVFDKLDISNNINYNIDIFLAYSDFIVNKITYCNNGIILSSIYLYLDWSVLFTSCWISSIRLVINFKSLVQITEVNPLKYKNRN